MNYNIRKMIFLIIALIWAIVIFAFSAKIVIIFVNLIFLTPYLPIMVTWR